MNNSELIKAVVDNSRYAHAKVDVKDILNTLSKIITEQLQAGEDVVLHVSLGTFKAVPRVERKGVNPITKEPLVIPAHIKPTFKISKTLKNAVN